MATPRITRRKAIETLLKTTTGYHSLPQELEMELALAIWSVSPKDARSYSSTCKRLRTFFRSYTKTTEKERIERTLQHQKSELSDSVRITPYEFMDAFRETPESDAGRELARLATEFSLIPHPADHKGTPVQVVMKILNPYYMVSKKQSGSYPRKKDNFSNWRTPLQSFYQDHIQQHKKCEYELLPHLSQLIPRLGSKQYAELNFTLHFFGYRNGEAPDNAEDYGNNCAQLYIVLRIDYKQRTTQKTKRNGRSGYVYKQMRLVVSKDTKRATFIQLSPIIPNGAIITKEDASFNLDLDLEHDVPDWAVSFYYRQKPCKCSHCTRMFVNY